MTTLTELGRKGLTYDWYSLELFEVYVINPHKLIPQMWNYDKALIESRAEELNAYIQYEKDNYSGDILITLLPNE